MIKPILAIMMALLLTACPLATTPTINQTAVISAGSLEVVSNNVTRLFANDVIDFETANEYFDKIDGMGTDLSNIETLLDACETPTCTANGQLELMGLKKLLDQLERDLLENQS